MRVLAMAAAVLVAVSTTLVSALPAQAATISRADLIARAKVNLNLHATDDFRHLSLARVGVLLNNRCAVVSEQADTHPELQALMTTTEYRRLAGACRALLARPDLDAVAEASFEGYRRIPMAEVLRPIVGD